MGILYDPHNVVIGQASGFFGPANEPLPAMSVPLYGHPANHATPGWGGNWVAAGATEEGFTLNGEQSSTDHNIEEQAAPVKKTLDSRSLGIGAQLAEDTLNNVRLAFGGGTITVTEDPDLGLLITRFTLSSNVDELAVGLDMATIDGKIRRIRIPTATSSENVEVNFRRAASKRLWPVQFVSTCREDEIDIIEIGKLPVPAP